MVGATTPKSRTGAIPPDLTVMTWTGPVALHEDAEGKARSEVAMAWRVLSHLAGLKERELPEHMSKTRPVKGGFHRNTLLPGRLLTDHDHRGNLDWSLADSGITDLGSIATDALLAAASRALLPSSGRLYFKQPDVRPAHTSLPRLSMEIAIDKGDWTIDSHCELEGCLRGFGIALAIVAYMDPNAAGEWDGHGVEFPNSATLRAALRPGLLQQAPARSKRVASFLQSVGLPDVAQEFLATYGLPESATC